MQTTFGVIKLALVDNRPQVLTLQGDACRTSSTTARRSWSGARAYELRKAEERAHILEGFRIALDNIDEIVELIKTSESPDDGHATRLMERFGLSEIQAQAILDMRLARLTGLEREKIEDEYRELIERISRAARPSSTAATWCCRSSATRSREVRRQLRRRAPHRDRRGRGRDRHRGPDRRRGHGRHHQQPGLHQAHPPGHLPPAGPRRQGHHRHAAPRTRTSSSTSSSPRPTSTCWSSPRRASCYWLKVHEIPKAGRAAQGQAHRQPDPDPARRQGARRRAGARVRRGPASWSCATSLGIVKRTPLTDFSRPRQAGIRAINLLEGEHLVAVRETDGEQRHHPGHAAAAWPSASTRPTCAPWAAPPAACAASRLGEGEEVVGMVVVDERRRATCSR